MTNSSTFDPNAIEVLTGLEPIRRRPAMYLGELTSPSLPARLLAQAMCHAVDEAVEGRPVTVSFRGTCRNRASVHYDAGMPLVPDPSGRNVALCFLTVLKACSNRKKNFAVGSAYCELGLAVLNACCSELHAEICHAGVHAAYQFQRGSLIHEDREQPADSPDFTRMEFELDPELLPGNFTFDFARVRDLIRDRAKLIPNLRVDLPDW